jgi:hypothetical protein
MVTSGESEDIASGLLIGILPSERKSFFGGAAKVYS